MFISSILASLSDSITFGESYANDVGLINEAIAFDKVDVGQAYATPKTPKPTVIVPTSLKLASLDPTVTPKPATSGPTTFEDFMKETHLDQVKNKTPIKEKS
ncbi:hypothetical protein VNO77_42699 [Canavalia gladiata]|uniref:Uncharacterized protein n=1 Tax=Canavalia gladiata TaxID=3824 RepID=A0AAN9JST0_CANGL